MSTTPINIAYPESGELQLKLALGACKLEVEPGAGGEWVQGIYDDPTGSVPLTVAEEGASVRIAQEYSSTDVWGITKGNAPKCTLALGTSQPYALTLEIGASDSEFELGGLPLTQLTIKQGAGKFEFDFERPNPSPMSRLELRAGASGIAMKRLANANFAELQVTGGAAAYKLDFGGTLQRDGNVTISAGLASVEVIVPAATAAKIVSESMLAGVDVGDGFMKREGAFWTAAALAGQTPLLTIKASVAFGSLRLRASE
jgi:hypothetical protein